VAIAGRESTARCAFLGAQKTNVASRSMAHGVPSQLERTDAPQRRLASVLANLAAAARFAVELLGEVEHRSSRAAHPEVGTRTRQIGPRTAPDGGFGRGARSDRDEDAAQDLRQETHSQATRSAWKRFQPCFANACRSVVRTPVGRLEGDHREQCVGRTGPDEDPVASLPAHPKLEMYRKELPGLVQALKVADTDSDLWRHLETLLAPS
jgi:hypothetical protein